VDFEVNVDTTSAARFKFGFSGRFGSISQEFPASQRITLWLFYIAMEAMAHEIDDFPSELNLHLFWGFSMVMLVITRW
jgi:hypothetical protein